MSPHQTIAVAVRLFALWVLIYVGRMLPSLYHEATNADDSSNMLLAIAVGSIAVLFFVLYLWFFPRTVARGLLDVRTMAAEDKGTPDTWFAVGCSLLGLWLIVPALSSVGYNLLVLYAAQRNPALNASEMRFGWSYYCIEIVLGVWLLLGARGARRLFWWARDREQSGGR
jgi:hypothetical protein